MPSVPLSDIECVNLSDISESRIRMLENGYASFDKVLNSSSDPITLDKSKKPYRIVDGQHRVYLARQKGYSSVNVKFI